SSLCCLDRTGLLELKTKERPRATDTPIVPIFCLFLSIHRFWRAFLSNQRYAGIEGENGVDVSQHSDRNQPLPVVAIRTELARKIAAHADLEGDNPTEVPGLRLYRRSAPTACTSAAYEPSLVVFVQGQKRINVGKATYLCNGSNFLLTSVDLPVVSQVVNATPTAPILGLVLPLEMPVVRQILNQEEFNFLAAPSGAHGMAIGVSSFELLSACSRLMDLL